MASYNLLTEPWIPVKDRSGKIVHNGILDTIRNAHEFTEVSDPAPPVQFGIYRLLIAFVTDVYCPADLYDLESLILDRKFDVSRLEAYSEKYKDRFDLFDPEHPYMQSPADPDHDKKKEPVARLMQHLPSGSNTVHFHHGNWEDHGFSYEQCARGLVTVAPFMTSGGKGYSPSINGTPPWYILVKGPNLFNTILYNVCVMPLNVKNLGDEPVAWRSTMKVEPKKELSQCSISQAFTWRPRRIRLLPGPVGTCTYTGKENVPIVKEMYYGPGFSFTGSWVDPQVAYKITDKGQFPIRPPIKPDETKELWRDIGPIMLLHDKYYQKNDFKIMYMRPSVVSQFRELIDKTSLFESDLNSALDLEVYGIRTDGNMKFYEWVFEKLSLPWHIFYRDNYGLIIQESMDKADLFSGYLNSALKRAYPRDSKGNAKALDTLIKRTQNFYWVALEPIFKNVFLKNMQEQQGIEANPAGLLKWWYKQLFSTGLSALNNTLDQLDSDAKELKRREVARSEYIKKAGRHLSPDKEKQSKKPHGGRKERYEH